VAPTASVLRLSDELLLSIASGMDGGDCNTHLCHLALSHRKFRHIAYEVLVRNAVLPIRSLPKYIDILSQHPSWIPHITHITLIDGDTSRPFKAEVSQQAVVACHAATRDLTPSYSMQDIEALLRADKDRPEIWLRLLFACLPNVKALTLQPTSASFHQSYRSFFLGDQHHASPNDFSQCLPALLRTLEVLEVISGPSVDRETIRASARFSHLANLRNLTVSGQFIQSGTDYPDPIARYPQFVLPWNLECLRIFCSKDTCPWSFLEILGRNLVAGQFPCLVRVQLFFNTSCRSLASSVMSLYPNPVFQDMRVFNLLTTWQTPNTSLETHFLERASHYEQSDLLRAIRCLEEETRRQSIDFPEVGSFGR
jgi:hypothetical protein